MVSPPQPPHHQSIPIGSGHVSDSSNNMFSGTTAPQPFMNLGGIEPRSTGSNKNSHNMMTSPNLPNMVQMSKHNQATLLSNPLLSSSNDGNRHGSTSQKQPVSQQRASYPAPSPTPSPIPTPSPFLPDANSNLAEKHNLNSRKQQNRHQPPDSSVIRWSVPNPLASFECDNLSETTTAISSSSAMKMIAPMNPNNTHQSLSNPTVNALQSNFYRAQQQQQQQQKMSLQASNNQVPSSSQPIMTHNNYHSFQKNPTNNSNHPMPSSSQAQYSYNAGNHIADMNGKPNIYHNQYPQSRPTVPQQTTSYQTSKQSYPANTIPSSFNKSPHQSYAPSSLSPSIPTLDNNVSKNPAHQMLPSQQQQDAPKRKLVLSKEGRQYLTQAVLSCLKSPTGEIDPVLLQVTMRETKMSEKAIYNAAKMVQQREDLKKRIESSGHVKTMANNNNNNNTSFNNKVPDPQQPLYHQNGHVQQQNSHHQQNGIQRPVSNISNYQFQHAPQMQGDKSTNISLPSFPSQQHHQPQQLQQKHNIPTNHPHYSTTPIPQSSKILEAINNNINSAKNRFTSGTTTAHIDPRKQAVSNNPVFTQPPTYGIESYGTLPEHLRKSNPFQTKEGYVAPGGLVDVRSKGPTTPRKPKPSKSKAKTSSISSTDTLNRKGLPVIPDVKVPTLTTQQIMDQQKQQLMKEKLRQESIEMANEVGKWRRFQNVLFISSNTDLPSIKSTNNYTASKTLFSSITGSDKLSTTKIVPMSLGAVTRTDVLQDALNIHSQKEKRLSQTSMKKSDTKESNCFAFAKLIQKQMQQDYAVNNKINDDDEQHKKADIIPRTLVQKLSSADVALLDVTEKYKRIKLQPRKESKLLDKLLRKHRQVVAESLNKKYKELNKSIIAHSTEFFKFHRLRKAEISRFARSVRDHITSSQKKKELDEEKAEKARIAALKSNDMAAYSALVEEARNERLKFLLDKTDECITQISGLLQNQNRDDPDNAKIDKVNISYYDSAHVRREDVKQPFSLVGGQLKDYQIGGLQWLVSLYNNKLNGILADEMGLGKTVQTIALISYLMEKKDNKGPYLVIVPLSTLSNWVNEFRRWCPSATVVVYKGTPAQRKSLYKSDVRDGHFNVLLTTYEYIIKDKSSLRKLEWQYAIVDEGHRMKNAQSKFSVTLGTHYTTKNRILLTGTPLQNNLPELWALLNFLLPTVFNSSETFDQWFNKPFSQFGTNTENQEEVVSNEERMLIIQRLHELLRPFMLRRIKSDVLDQLPDKVEKVLRCELSSWQKELYKQISYSALDADGVKRTKRGLNNIVMQLRKVCNHPYMFSSEGYYISDELIKCSGKVELLDRMLPKLKAGGHRILMFFQMTAAMTILEDYFQYRGYLSLRLDGSTTGEERERRMELFNSPDSPYFIFLLSTRAGGLGLNLVSADTVIIFDSDWNPMMDLQAQDRAHRIGQRKIVSVFRLVTNSPVEEKILSRASEKLNMSELVVEAGKFDKSSVEDDNTEERLKMMELLLIDFESTGPKGVATASLQSSDDEGDGDDDCNEDKEEIGLNELLSRNDEDYELYSKIDSGAITGDEFFKSPGLYTDASSLPDWIKYPYGRKDDSQHGSENGIDDTKRRAAANITYNDGLTDRQFLRLMEKQADQEDAEAKARKEEWKLKRDKNAAAKLQAATAIESGATDQNIVTEIEGNSNTPQNSLPPETYERFISIVKSVIALKEPSTKRRRSDIFRERPCQKTYPDYYLKITHPISINDIMRKCREKEYSSIRDFRDDWSLMFHNAVLYNGEDSWIVADGTCLDTELNRLMEKNDLFPEECTNGKKFRIKLSLKKLKQGDNDSSKKRKNSSSPQKNVKKQRSSSDYNRNDLSMD